MIADTFLVGRFEVSLATSCRKSFTRVGFVSGCFYFLFLFIYVFIFFFLLLFSFDVWDWI